SFVLATLILYWAGWHELHIALPVLLAAVLVFAYQQWRTGFSMADLRAGAWLVGYLLLIMGLSAAGSFDGHGWIGSPWDSVVVGAVAVGAFVLGVRAAGTYLAEHPPPDPVVSDAAP